MAKSDIKKSLSLLIPKELPQFIIEDHPNFVKFLQYYYDYIDQFVDKFDLQSALDVDSIEPSLIESFRKDFLSNIPLSQKAEFNLLIKHIKQFYLHKGDENSYRFLFKILFPQDELDFYYPSDDILIADGGIWEQEVHLIIEDIDPNPSRSIPNVLSGTRIYGLESKASSLVYKVNTLLIPNRYKLILDRKTIFGKFNLNEELKVTLNNKELPNLHLRVLPIISKLVFSDNDEYNYIKYKDLHTLILKNTNTANVPKENNLNAYNCMNLNTNRSISIKDSLLQYIGNNKFKIMYYNDEDLFEIGDFVEIQTNDFDDSGERIKYNGLIVDSKEVRSGGSNYAIGDIIKLSYEGFNDIYATVDDVYSDSDITGRIITASTLDSYDGVPNLYVNPSYEIIATSRIVQKIGYYKLNETKDVLSLSTNPDFTGYYITKFYVINSRYFKIRYYEDFSIPYNTVQLTLDKNILRLDYEITVKSSTNEILSTKNPDELEPIIIDLSSTTDNWFTFSENDNGSASNPDIEYTTIFYKPGYYYNHSGFIDSEKKLRDDYFYQEFSYQLVTNNVCKRDWGQPVHNLLHPAGTKDFGKLIIVTRIDDNNFNIFSDLTLVIRFKDIHNELIFDKPTIAGVTRIQFSESDMSRKLYDLNKDYFEFSEYEAEHPSGLLYSNDSIKQCGHKNFVDIMERSKNLRTDINSETTVVVKKRI